jgi:thioredoxin 1
MATETTDTSFKTDVLDQTVPVLVDFWAPWCGPCRLIGPIIEKLGEEAGDRAKVFKMNVDENPQTASSYGISAIPTVMLFKGGQIEKQFVGVQPEQVYRQALGI